MGTSETVRAMGLVGIEKLAALRVIEMIGLVRLGMPQLNAAASHGHKPAGDPLRAIVEARCLRPALPRKELFQIAHHSLSLRTGLST